MGNKGSKITISDKSQSHLAPSKNTDDFNEFDAYW